ncbi:hypothetical protein [Glutamicibacter sp. 2E12]|uniref:hypothetical protein n=1 Tax=Glutamicibacter sp. 2E12 TaxID=3416181 RepID=UPI003CF3FB80
MTKLATGTFLKRIQRPSARLTKLWVIARQKFHPLVSIVHNDSKTGDKLTEIITTTVALVGLFVTAAQFTAAARARKAADFWGDQIEKPPPCDPRKMRRYPITTRMPCRWFTPLSESLDGSSLYQLVLFAF